MVSLHQLRCFLAVLETGSITAAADQMGFAQPSVSAQIRLLESGLGAQLFRRAGRGVVPTEAARALQGPAERAVEAAAEARRAVSAVAEGSTGTVRLGVFGTARLYLAGDLASDVLRRYPGVRLELFGQNSRQVLDELRAGRVDAAVVALPIEDAGLIVTPSMRDEVVYVSAHPDRIARPVGPAQLADARLVLWSVSWGNEDSTRRQLATVVQQAGRTLQPAADVEDIETAIDICATGVVDTVANRGALLRLAERLPPQLGWVPLRPRMFDTFALVRRRDATLSAVTEFAVSTAGRMLHDIAEELSSTPRARTPGR